MGMYPIYGRISIGSYSYYYQLDLLRFNIMNHTDDIAKALLGEHQEKVLKYMKRPKIMAFTSIIEDRLNLARVRNRQSEIELYEAVLKVLEMAVMEYIVLGKKK
jgi:hypothetical protein